MRNDPNKVLRTSASTTVNARDYTMVLANATGGAIALVLITPAAYSEWSIKVANIGSGSDVTLSVAGGGSFSHVLPAGAACEVSQDDLGVLHVFGSVSAGGGSGIGGSGTPGTLPLFITATTVGDSVFNQSSGVGSIGADFGVDESDGEIVTYGGSAPTDGQLIIGDTGSTMKLGVLASADSSVTITNSAGGIDLSVPLSMETPTGAVDGINDDFVFTSPPILVTYQGIIQDLTTDYTLVGSTVTFTVPPVSGTVKGLVTS